MTAGYEPPGPGDVRSAPWFLWWLLRTQGSRVAGAATLGTLWMVGLTLPPYLLSRAIDDGLQRHDFPALVGWVGVLLAVGVLTAALAIMRHRTMTRVRMDAAFRMVHATVERSTQLGAALSRRVGAGEMLTIGIGDVWVISTSLTFVGPGVGAIVAYLVVAGLLFSIAPILALVILLGAPVVAVVIGPLLGRLRRVGTVYRAEQGALTAGMVDIVDGLRVLNGIGGKDRYGERYRNASRELQAEGYRVGAVSSWVPAVAVGLPVIFLAAVTWLAARMAAQGHLSIGDLVAVYGYVAVLVAPISELIDSGSTLSQAVISVRRVIALWQIDGDGAHAGRARVAAPTRSADLRDPASGVDVRDALFTALACVDNVDGTAVLDRLGGFTASDATWGDVAIADVSAWELRQRILVADNEADIFAGSLRDIVRGRGDADAVAVSRALDVALAQDIVDELPAGLDSAVNAQARDLSGGQRQRIRLARAVLTGPEVLLAVEPTSAVDAHTEAAIAQRLWAARAGRTTVVVTTSPILLDQADVVHFVVGGRVVDSGTHRELLARRVDYRDLVSRDLADDDARVAPAGSSRPAGP